MANEQMKISIVLDGKDNASPALTEVDKKVKGLKESTDSSAASTKSFGETWGVSASGLLAASAVIGTAIVQLNQLGAQANAAEKTFTQVTGGAEEAAASLARMRSQTGGVIDDMSLMKGANSLLVTGIAQTNEQAEQLVNLGARLGTVMGVDAASSIENLNSALLNNSFMRLDTLGISAAEVRGRVNELKEAGMDMSAAFSQAVLEIGEQTLTDLGSAAAVSETAINRLTTSFQNLAQDLGQNVNIELEKMAVTLEQMGFLWNLAMGNETGNAEIDAQIAKTEQLTARTNELILAREQALLQQNVPVQDLGMLGVSNQQFMDYAGQNQEALPTIGTGTFFTDAIAGDMAGDAAEAKRIISELTNVDVSGMGTAQLLVVARDADIAFSSIAQAQGEMEAATEAATEAQVAQTAQLEAQTQAYTDFNTMEAQAVDNMIAMRGMNEALTASMQSGAFSSASGTSFFDPAQLAQVQSQTEEIVAEYERLKELGESSEFTLVSEIEVDRARTIAEQAQATAEQSERNAAAWEKASLAMIAGAGGGGRENEFNQRVLANIEDPEERAALERQMNLNSGVENENTDVLNYGEELVGAIYSEQGIAAASEASETFVQAFEDGLMAGLSGEALKTYIEGEVGYALSGEAGSSGAEITVQAGEGYIALAQRTGRSREELEAATGGTMLQAGQVITLDDGSALIAIGEDTSVQEATQSAAQNVMIGAGMPLSDPMAMGTTYDPATGQYIAPPPDASMAGTQGSMFPSETTEAVTQMATDMLSVETSVMNISQTDVSASLDPIISDIDIANAGITEFEGSMTRLTGADWSLEVPIAFVFDDQTAETLSRNSQVVEVVRLVLGQLQVDMPSQ